MFIFLSICSLLVPLSMILFGYKWKNNPPKDRYGVSGYRTTMSRLNDDTWKCAHQYWGKINIVLGIILVTITFCILAIMKNSTDFEMIITYLVFIQLGVMAITIIPTELLLHKTFTKTGSKKQTSSHLSSVPSSGQHVPKYVPLPGYVQGRNSPHSIRLFGYGIRISDISPVPIGTLPTVLSGSHL